MSNPLTSQRSWRSSNLPKVCSQPRSAPRTMPTSKVTVIRLVMAANTSATVHPNFTEVAKKTGSKPSHGESASVKNNPPKVTACP
jgi:hypothetical protein